MPIHSRHRTLSFGVLAAAALLALAGCTSTGATPNASSSAPSSSAAAPTAEPTPAAALDPADPASWVITADAVGPIARGADAAATVAELTAFEANEWCPGTFELRQAGAAQIMVTTLDDGTVRGVWVSGGADPSVAVPGSPATETGVMLGSTMDELSAAYPDLTATNQVGPESYGYANGDEAEGFVNFVVTGDRVITIGVQDQAAVPKELCG